MKKSMIVFLVLFSFVSLQISGQTWSSLKRLTWNAGDSKFPSIATDSGSGVHVLWHDDSPGNREIFYKRSTDGGTTWSALKRLTWNTGSSFISYITTDSGTGIHVVWRDDTPGNYEIFYKRSLNGGSTWSAPKRLTWNAGTSMNPVIATDSGNGIHVAWYDDTPGGYDIFYKRSIDNGASWSGLTRLTWNVGGSFSPSIATDSSSGIYVAWYDHITNENSEIFYKRSTDGGANWTELKRLTWTAGFSVDVCITTEASSKIHIVWQDQKTGNWEIFYKRSTNSGTNWFWPTRLTWNMGNSIDAFITTDSGNGIHVAWYDDSPGNYEIFYKRSSNSGTAWSGATRLTWNAGESKSPAIAADSGNGIHVVWYDDSPGNHEIFYKNRK